jgi:hypothetical protein
MRHVRSLGVGLALFGLAACGSSTPTTPSTPSTPTTTATKIISLSGNLNFGLVNFGSSLSEPFTISNSGNATLTFANITASSGTGSKDLTVSTTAGTVPAGGSVTINVTFTPTIAQGYSTVITVVSDATSGNNGINLIGTGVNNTPLFTMSGTGNTIFEIPSTVTKLHIVGTLNSGSANFAVWSGPQGAGCGVNINGACHLLVNDLIGPLFGKTSADEGTLATGGPPATEISILNSAGVSWTMTEVR